MLSHVTHPSFKEAVILAMIGLTALCTGLLHWRSTRCGGAALLPARWSRYLLPLALLLLGALAVYSLALTGPRDSGWFAVQMASALVLWMASLGGRQRPLLLCCSAALVALTTVAILHAQGIGVTNEDQWRDAAAEYDVLVRGNLDRARGVMGGYYSVVPALPILIPFISTLTGLDLFSTNFVVAPLFTFMGALALMLLVARLTGFAGAPALVALLILSTPRLNLWLLLHQTASMVLAAIALLLLHRAYLWKPHLWSRGAALCVMLLVFTLNATHPSGTIAVLLFTWASLLVARVPVGSPLPPVAALRLRWLLVTLSTLVTAYWWFTKLVNFLSQNYLREFALQFTGLHPYRVSLNAVAGNQYTALAWALPVALSLAYLSGVGLQLVRKLWRRKGMVEPLFCASYAVIALVTLLAGFAAWSLRGSEGSFERYLSVPAYLLLTVPAAAGARAILARGRLRTMVLAPLLLAVLFTAADSLEWAPDLNQAGGNTTAREFAVTRHLARLLPPDGRVGAMTQYGSPLQYESYAYGRPWLYFRTELQAAEYNESLGLNRDIRAAISTPPPSPGNQPTFLIVEYAYLRGLTLPVGTDLIYSGGTTVVLVPRTQFLCQGTPRGASCG
ncbi:MAG TPA: hypothetical protein VJY65_01775 [Chloroflexota bacterium]|nr:hypothetical protein [Chloroflexota bacterium]